MDTGIHTTAVTSSDPDERPWRRRSRLYDREAEIRRLQSEGYSLAQIIRRLGLDVSRPYLWRFLRRSTAAARPAGEPAASASPVTPSEAEAADDAAAEALLDASGFSPPLRPSRK